MASLATYGTFLNEKAAAALATRRHLRRHALTAPHPSTWMSHLPPSTLLSSLSLPGTHDSATSSSHLPFIVTQSLDLAAQLDAGIRYLDLRCGLRNSALVMVHGSALLGPTLAHCLATLYAWLAAHPAEALVVQIKQDRAPEGGDPSLGFGDAVAALLGAEPGRWVLDGGAAPTLATVRGRILLFRRFDGAGGVDVTRWRDNPARPFRIRNGRGAAELVVQDHYNPVRPVGLAGFVEEKVAVVAGLLGAAAADAEMRVWYVNFCSGFELNVYYQASPWDVAVGGWGLTGWIEGVNARLLDELKAGRGRRRRLGIVVLDYLEQPEPELVGHIIATNFEPAEMRMRVSSRAVLVMAVLLLLVFVAGSLILLVHGPAKSAYCSPLASACWAGRLRMS